MQYIIFVDGAAGLAETDEPVLWSHPVPPEEQAYLRESVFPAMQPLSKEAYWSGPANILNTAARWSYVLDSSVVYWCVEWEPGLVVVRFAPDGALAWAQIPSPNPQFGGRTATEEELDNYDEDNAERTHQYNLIFDPWDAQFDPDDRAEWEVADDDTKSRFKAALAPVREKPQEARKTTQVVNP